MNRIKVNLQQSIIVLAERGWSKRRIARELKVDRRTVDRHVAAKAATSPALGSVGVGPPAGDDAAGEPNATTNPGVGSELWSNAASNPGVGSRPGPAWSMTIRSPHVANYSSPSFGGDGGVEEGASATRK